MKIAGAVDLEETLRRLARLRPVFHSEADFQLALAWQFQQDDSAMGVRLETRPAAGVHLDLALSRPDLGRSTALELKYLTRAWSGEANGEHYALKNHGAQDIRGYDVVKDIARVERFISRREGANGAVVVLANDAAYWRPPKTIDPANAAAFRLGEGVVLSGRRSWGPNVGGTIKGREKPIDLLGRYELHWTDYAVLPGEGSAVAMRQLVIPVEAA
jgi:hypothetical protein